MNLSILPQIHVQGVIEEQYRRIASILKFNANVFGGRRQTNKQVFDNVNAQIEVEFVLEVIVFFIENSSRSEQSNRDQWTIADGT